MPRKAKKEKINCLHFTWRLGRRGNVYTADGRSNAVDLGRHSLGTDDYDEARRQLARLDLAMAVEHGYADASALTDEDAEPLPLEEGKEHYLAFAGRPRAAKGVRPSSLRKYRNVLRKFVAFAAGRGLKTWNQVKDETLFAYAADLEERGRSPRTVAFELTTLLQAIKWLAKAGHLPPGFKVEVEVEKPDGTDAYCFTREQVVAMREFCLATPGLEWLADAVWALALTGMRVSELAGLRWSDLDLAAGTVTLVDESGLSAAKRKGRTARTVKSGRRRTFPIHEELRPVLEALPRHPDGYVFRGPGGAKLTDRHVRTRLKAEVVKPLSDRFPSPEGERGFADGTPHSFRHFFCSSYANEGISEQLLMRWLGHKSSAMVRHYYHVHDEEARRQMARVSLGERKTA